ncbi:hypothetical protein [Geofilum rubicundum]|nr:hypothetical protein [Geofilum rubicundum]
MDKTELLNNLISEGERLTSTIQFVPSPPNIIRMYSVYHTTEGEKYQDWLSTTQRFIKTYFPSDLPEVKGATQKLSPDNHQTIIGILRAIKLLPDEPKMSEINNPTGTNIVINNTQKVVLNLFTEAIKDEISGKDYKELKEILKNYEKEPDKAKTKLIEKLKGFGSDILTNIVANIMTNPNFYSGLF